MKRVITAIGHPEINNKLAENENIKIIGKDIQYQEAVFEVLEKNKVDILIIKKNLPGELTSEELIKKIKINNEKIKIIYLLEENEKKENSLKEKNKNLIFLNNKKNIENLLEEINKIININYKKESKDFLNNKEINNKIKNREFFKKKLNKEYDSKNNFILSIYGNKGVGKSTSSIILSQIFEELGYKEILIFDSNIYNQNIYSILGKKKYSKNIYKKIKEEKKHEKINKKTKEKNFYEKLNKKNTEKINNKIIKKEANKKIINYYKKNIEKIAEDFIIKINKNIDFISGLNLLFKKKNFNEKEKKILIKKIMKKLKEKYSIIIIDTSTKDEFKINEVLFKESSKIILLVEGNLLGIRGGKEALRKCINEYKIDKNSLHIIANKYNKNSIDFLVFKNCFSPFCVDSKINYNNSHIQLIKNKDKSIYNFLNKREINIYKKIIKNKIKLDK